MRPVPIPDEAVWEGAVRRVVAGPGGDLTGDIRPVEALIDADDYGPRFNMLIRLDPGDLEQLQESPHFWLTWHGDHLHPFSVTMPPRRVCRVCGCTEDRACKDPETGQGCSWAAEDLCSVCARRPS